MEKYKVKEEVKKFFNKNSFISDIKELKEWFEFGIKSEHLEEVEERIEISDVIREDYKGLGDKTRYTIVFKTHKDPDFVTMEKALNGELSFSKENLKSMLEWLEDANLIYSTEKKESLKTWNDDVNLWIESQKHNQNG